MVRTFSQVYAAEVAKLEPFQLVMLGVATEIAITFFEIPTGVVADSISRKLSVVIGCVVTGAAFLWMGSMPVFWALVLGSFCWGLGSTFISGARDAWAADELPFSSSASIGQSQLFLRGAQSHFLGAICGIWAGALLTLFGQNLPLLGAGIGMILFGFALAWVMPEQGFSRFNDSRGRWQIMKETVTEGWRQVRVKAALTAILVLTVLFGLASEGVDRLWNKLILDNFTLPPIGGLNERIWWALIGSAVMGLAYLSTEWIKGRLHEEDETGLLRMLGWITVIQMVGVLLFAVAGNFWWAVGAFLLARTTRRCTSPLMTAWINRHTPSSVRATVLSFEGQAHGVGEIFGGTTAGAIGQWASVRWAVAFAGSLLIPAWLVIQRQLVRSPKS